MHSCRAIMISLHCVLILCPYISVILCFHIMPSHHALLLWPHVSLTLCHAFVVVLVCILFKITCAGRELKFWLTIYPWVFHQVSLGTKAAASKSQLPATVTITKPPNICWHNLEIAARQSQTASDIDNNIVAKYIFSHQNLSLQVAACQHHWPLDDP
jgi:hypothetical protein